MKILTVRKDGGPESRVTGYWLIELKSLFTVALLRFDHGTREAYHSHAFNCISWVLKGKLEEHVLLGCENSGDEACAELNVYRPSLKPVITRRSTFHKVFSHGRTWVLTFRGPWADRWKERIGSKEITLTHGRAVID